MHSLFRRFAPFDRRRQARAAASGLGTILGLALVAALAACEVAGHIDQSSGDTETDDEMSELEMLCATYSPDACAANYACMWAVAIPVDELRSCAASPVAAGCIAKGMAAAAPQFARDRSGELWYFDAGRVPRSMRLVESHLGLQAALSSPCVGGETFERCQSEVGDLSCREVWGCREVSGIEVDPMLGCRHAKSPAGCYLPRLVAPADPASEPWGEAIDPVAGIYFATDASTWYLADSRVPSGWVANSVAEASVFEIATSGPDCR